MASRLKESHTDSHTQMELKYVYNDYTYIKPTHYMGALNNMTRTACTRRQKVFTHGGGFRSGLELLLDASRNIRAPLGRRTMFLAGSHMGSDVYWRVLQQHLPRQLCWPRALHLNYALPSTCL